MAKNRNLLFLPIAIFFIASTNGGSSDVNAAGTNGADIYCLMRDGGNGHESSWQAAYESIKKAKPGLFKTSPKQAAAMIIEEVVQDTEKYNDCISFLGDLFPTDQISTTSEGNNNFSEAESSAEDTENTYDEVETKNDIKPTDSPNKGEYIDRYSY